MLVRHKIFLSEIKIVEIQGGFSCQNVFKLEIINQLDNYIYIYEFKNSYGEGKHKGN